MYYCPFKTKWRLSLQYHVTSQHLDDKEIKWHECDKCPYRSKFNSELKKHRDANHSEEAKWYECAKYSYKTKVKSYLVQHVTVHFDQYQCEYCPYKTKRSCYLKTHISHRHLNQIYPDGKNVK
ncbi:hypothetical protein Zmor_015550 [Zophobas morio]|uniref:C2H2-type domain-containing protein n=1 Tax=Zophobas morio TaxID=2755281 RepID=A0AA38IGY8_9CUCU|nr:hypothetical protein Zmor_015550 [Zophobas morio]